MKKQETMRYLIPLFSVFMQLCLGATYSWSLFVKPLRLSTGLSQGMVQLPFTLFYFIFPATLFYSSFFYSRLGPRKCAVLGGFLFGGGWILAGLGSASFVLTALGIGVLAGAGAGMAYIVPITVCMYWFPRHKGLMTGIAVAGFGGGAALVTQIGGRLMQNEGFTVFETMTFFGYAFLLLIGLSGLFMVGPDRPGQAEIPRKSLKQTVGQAPFRLLYGAMLVGLAAGFAVNANLKEIQPMPDLETGILAVSLFAVANALGRIVWGTLIDRFEPARMIQLNLLVQAAVLFIFPLLLRENWAMVVFAALSGFNYGGVLVIYAATVSHIWGTEHVSRVYGWLFSANIPAALAPIVAGFVYDQTTTFFPALIGLGIILLLAAAAVNRLQHMMGSGEIETTAQ